MPSSTPTVYQNPSSSGEAGASNYTTFQATYNIVPGTTPAQEILNLFHVVINNSQTNTTKNANQAAISALVTTLCTNYPNSYIGTPLCQPSGCGYATSNWPTNVACPSYASVAGDATKPYPNYGGWYQYCANPSNLNSSGCNSFYLDAQSGNNVPNANVGQYLKNVCAAQCSGPDPNSAGGTVLLGTGALPGTPTVRNGAVASIPITIQTGGLYSMNNVPAVIIDPPTPNGTTGQATAVAVLTVNPNDPTKKTGYVSAINVTSGGSGYTAAPSVIVNDTITKDQYTVCGCFLPQGVYTKYQTNLNQKYGFTQVGHQPQECFYPMCINSTLKSESGIQCSTIYQNCTQTFSPTIVAGGNISNVTIANNQGMTCTSSITSGGNTTTANYTPAPASMAAPAAPAAPASMAAPAAPAAPAATAAPALPNLVAAAPAAPALPNLVAAAPALPNLAAAATGGKKLSAGAIAGIGVAAAVVVIVVILLLLKFVFKLF